MTVLSVLATVFGLGEGLFNLPQAYRIFKRKSAKDLSIITYSFQITSVVVWLLYGFEIKNNPIILSNLFATITLAIVIIGWVIYGREKISQRKLENKTF